MITSNDIPMVDITITNNGR